MFCMEKTDIEFWNGLTKGIIKCNEIVENSESIEEAKAAMDSLIRKARGKIVRIVDRALD